MLPSLAAGVLLVSTTGATLGSGTLGARPSSNGVSVADSTVAPTDLLAGNTSPSPTRPPEVLRADEPASRNHVRPAQDAHEEGAGARAQQRARAQRARDRERRAEAHRWVRPADGRLTSRFGYRWGRLHAGVDLAVPVGTPLRAMSSGTVTKAGWDGGGGFVVAVRQWDGTVIMFLHLSRGIVRVGQQVRPGQLVGYSGSTGHSTGPHLHLEVHPRGGDPVDPLPWLARHHVRL